MCVCIIVERIRLTLLAHFEQTTLPAQAVGASLVTLMQGDKIPEPWLQWTLVISVWLAVLSTIYSGLGYVFAAMKYIRD